MKTIALTLLVAALGFAQDSTHAATSPAPKDSSKTAATTAKKKPSQPAKPTREQLAKAQQTQTQAIPAGAKLVEPNLYRYTDSNGKTWNYRQTPFGVSKWEETSGASPQPAPQAAAPQSPVVVTDLGDSYRFEKKTPFGQSSWTRKKSELTDEEKALAGDQQTQSSKAAGNQ